jgi:hypothetical protein
MSITNGHDPSLSQLEKAAARNRADLLDTVDELQTRVSPSAIKRDVQDFVRETKAGIWRDLEQKARENPLQAVAVAAGVAFPLLRIATALPAPLLLIAAGFALTRRSSDGLSGGARMSEKAGRAANDMSDAMAARLDQVSSAVEQGAQAAREATHDARDKLSGMAAEATETAKDLMNQASDRLTKGMESAGSMGSSLSAKATETASATYQMATEAISTTYQKGADLAATARDQFAEKRHEAQVTFVDTIQQNPLIAGGVGLAIGAVIAAALPKTAAEEKLLAGAGAALKDKASDLATQSFEAAKSAARSVYDETLNHASEQGLSSQAVQETAAKLGENVKTALRSAAGSESKASSQ